MPHASDDNLRTLKQAHQANQVPLLLKPNGVPVFQNVVGGDGAQFAQTIASTNYAGTKSEWMKTGQQDQTVKAHSFVVGKKIQNVTEIAKTTCPEEQAMPIRIIYVKPGINRPNTLVRNRDNQNELTLKRGEVGLNHELEKAISLGDISGIFKTNPTRRVKSAQNNDKEKRIKAQRAYAEQVRLENKVKE